MNKKLLVGVLAAGLLVGCAPSDPIAVEGKSFHIAGQQEVLVDGTWTANAWEAKATNEMKAASLADVKALDKDLYNVLKEKDLAGLYIGDVRMGVASAGWNADAMKDGAKVSVDGSFAIKCIRATYLEEDASYLNDQWISDPKTAHAEALTDNIFMPVWQEEADENGFSWGSNPVCIGDAGTYKFVVAQYNAVSAPDTAGFGFGLVLVEAAA